MGETIGKLYVESHIIESGVGIDLTSNAFVADSDLNPQIMANMSYAISKSSDVISSGHVQSFLFDVYR